MSALTVSNLEDEVIAELERRATTRGVTVEAEARSILGSILPAHLRKHSEEENRGWKEHLLSFPDVADEDAWVFDRHDPRNARPERPQVDFSE